MRAQSWTAMTPNRKTNGSRTWITDGDCSRVRRKMSPALTSVRTPTVRDRVTNCTSRIIEEIITRATPTPTILRLST